MGIAFKHKRLSKRPPSPTDIIGSTEWNDDHILSDTTIQESDVHFALDGHDHDNFKSAKVLKVTLADATISVKEKKVTDLYREASSIPIENEVVILDSNGAYCQADIEPVIKKYSNTTQFGKKKSGEKTIIVGTSSVNICRNCSGSDGIDWFFLKDGVTASRIELNTETPMYHQSKNIPRKDLKIKWNSYSIKSLVFPNISSLITTMAFNTATPYQNLTQSPFFITMSIFMNAGGNLNVYCGPSLTGLVADENKIAYTSCGMESVMTTLSFWVLPNYYYIFKSVGGASINKYNIWT